MKFFFKKKTVCILSLCFVCALLFASAFLFDDLMRNKREPQSKLRALVEALGLRKKHHLSNKTQSKNGGDLEDTGAHQGPTVSVPSSKKSDWLEEGDRKEPTVFTQRSDLPEGSRKEPTVSVPWPNKAPRKEGESVVPARGEFFNHTQDRKIPLGLPGRDYIMKWHKMNLEGKNFQGENFQLAFLAGKNMRNARLQGANMSEAYLHRADFRGANVQGVNFEDAVGLETVQWQGAIYDQHTIFPKNFNPESKGMIGL